jgi:GDP-L-fucose synthase
VEIWGTGKPTREFLFVEDAVRGIILATEKYNKPEPVNLGASFEISIKELATLIMKLTGYQGKIVFNTSKPDGQPRRKLDVTRAKKEFGFEAETKFAEGLKKTIRWYEKNN